MGASTLSIALHSLLCSRALLLSGNLTPVGFEVTRAVYVVTPVPSRRGLHCHPRSYRVGVMLTVTHHRPATIELSNAEGKSVARMPLTRPIDDLIALERPIPSDSRRPVSLLQDYGLPLAELTPILDGPLPEDVKAYIRIVRKAVAREVFSWVEEAATTAISHRRLTERAAELLASVEFLGLRIARVGDVLPLVAWTTLVIAQNGLDYELRPCAFCGVPFLATERARYCRRVAPGRESNASPTCLEVGKVRDHRNRKKKGAPVG